MIYLMVLYTGLRSCEMKDLKWKDFEFDANPPCVRVPSSLSKNSKKSSVHSLRPEFVAALMQFRAADSAPSEWAFKGEDATGSRVPA